ncbi:hypothetical protein QQ045_021968 [Rhodiola kirilowii]
MASKIQTFMLLFLSITTLMMDCDSALPSSHHHFKIGLPVTSTISASPSYLFPDSFSPISAPSPSAMSPDVTPLLPSPAPDSGLSPSDSSFPTIPSNPSPPNPESFLAPQPLMASSPTGLMPDSSSVELKLSGALFMPLFALWLVQI